LRELWRVGDVKHLGTELEVGLFNESGAFDEGDVEVAVGWAATGLRDALPMTNCGAVPNAAVLK
jgi:hypothetical protein